MRLTPCLLAVALTMSCDTALSETAPRARGCTIAPDPDFTQTLEAEIFGDPVSLRVSSRFGGAIESVMFRGQEYINTFDHGRQISYAWQMNGMGECWNPTEPGSMRDDVGPRSTTVLEEVCIDPGGPLYTRARPAFWMLPGDRGFCDNGQVEAVNTTPVSDQVFEKRVSIGFEGIENVIVFEATITTQADYDFLQLEVPTTYLRGEFDTAWRYDPMTRSLIHPPPEALVDPWSFVSTGLLPPVFATTDGQHAFGAFTDGDIVSYEMLVYDGTEPDDATSKWNLVAHEYGAPAGRYHYRAFAVFGTLDEVLDGLQRLQDIFPVETGKPEGYVDAATCRGFDGWAWDPKTPDEPIEVQIFRFDPDGERRLVQTVLADDYRPDLREAGHGNGRHAFFVPARALVNGSEPTRFALVAVNSNTRLPDQPLRPSVVELTCP